MNKLWLLAATAFLGFVMAQTSGFVVSRTPGLANQVLTTETNPRAAELRVRCVGNQPEVVLDPKIALPNTQPPVFAWRFDDKPASQSRFDFVPESGELILPQPQIAGFLQALANSSQLNLRLVMPTKPVWEASFNTTGFAKAFAELPCNDGRFAQSQTTSPTTPNTPPAQSRILDATVAFISPLEFSQAFGGRFFPENGKLVWEYNGRRLLLERGSTVVVNTINNTRLELPRPVQEVSSRTVIPARVVAAFDCGLAQTKPTDAKVTVACGGGATRIERSLQRY